VLANHRAAVATSRRLGCNTEVIRERILVHRGVEGGIGAGLMIRLSRSITSVLSGFSTSPHFCTARVIWSVGLSCPTPDCDSGVWRGARFSIDVRTGGERMPAAARAPSG
jgi:hypothetical protein